MEANLAIIPGVIHLVKDVALADDILQQAILLSYQCNCPAIETFSLRMVP